MHPSPKLPHIVPYFRRLRHCKTELTSKTAPAGQIGRKCPKTAQDKRLSHQCPSPGNPMGIELESNGH